MKKILKKIKAIKETCICGRTIERIFKLPSGNHKGKRQGRKNITADAVRKNNDIIAERSLRRLIATNFGLGDGFFTLTYADAPSQEQAKRDLDNFIKRLRRKFKKSGKELKYIAVTEYEHKRIHHHLILNTTDADLINTTWDLGYIKASMLDDSGNYHKLAAYLIKETQKTFREDDCIRKKRYTSSTNLIKPIVKREVVEVSELFEEPKAIKGYYIDQDTYRRYEHPVTGLEYVEYIEVAIDKPRKYKAWPKGKKVKLPDVKYRPTDFESQLNLWSMANLILQEDK